MTPVKVPPLGESITEATVSRWLKNEGDTVAPGETIVELETDKITVEVPSVAGGVVTKRHHVEGDIVHVDDLLAELEDVGRTADVRSAPAARRLAADSNVDLTSIAGTGRGGVVSKSDVIDASTAALRNPPGAVPPSPPITRPPASARPAPAPGGPVPPGTRETRERMSTRRKRIAENLLQAQQATAHLTTFNEIDMGAVMALRARLKDRVEKEHGVKLSFMPFFVKAVCQAIGAYPVVNAQIDGDSIVYKHYVHVGIAVASDAGLVVPNIRDADQKGLIAVAREMGTLAARARDGKLTLDDLTGGSFTITNGGIFGSLISTPIINYPQVAILGLHKIQDRAVVVEGQVVVRPMMYVALSYDHRIIDGQQAVLFLVRVKELMEEPAAMLVE
jgi:2-oxoglutarate dehydrogenase E2 component (dihydrolipoamide succinyltransferase)